MLSYLNIILRPDSLILIITGLLAHFRNHIIDQTYYGYIKEILIEWKYFRSHIRTKLSGFRDSQFENIRQLPGYHEL